MDFLRMNLGAPMVQRKYQEQRQITKEWCVYSATSEMHVAGRHVTTTSETRKAEEMKSSDLRILLAPQAGQESTPWEGAHGLKAAPPS